MFQKLITTFNVSNKVPLVIGIGYFSILAYIVFFQHNVWSEWDGVYYLRLGEQILNGNGINVKTVNAPIGGPIVYAQINEFIQDGFLTMKLIALFSGTGIVFVSYYIIKNLFNSKIALVGQLLVAFSPRLELQSILALNEMLATLLVIISIFFITKKFVNTRDIVIIGILLASSFMIRYQSILVLLAIGIFLLVRDKKIKKNIISVLILLFTFIIISSPLLSYNYFTHDSFLDNESNWFIYANSKFQNPQWHNNLEEIIVEGSSQSAIFLDFDLFAKNYFYNLLYHNPNLLFNFNSIEHNMSVIPIIPFLGMMTFLGGLIYCLKPKLNQKNIIFLGTTIIIVTTCIFIFGNINMHFSAIIFTPICFLVIIFRKNIEKNILPLLILPITFFLGISIVPLVVSEQLLMTWIFLPVFTALFLVKVLPNIYSNIFKRKNKENNQILIITMGIIILMNVGFSYHLFEFYLFDEKYDGMVNEFKEIFQFEILQERGLEMKEIGEFLSTQENIEEDYVMADQRGYPYYANSKFVWTYFHEGKKGDDLNKFVNRENWSPYEIWFSDSQSFPMDRYGKSNPKIDYIIYESDKPKHRDPSKEITGQFLDLEILFDPENINIPNNFELIYKSNKTGTVVYKINH